MNLADKLRDILTYTDKQRLPDDIVEADIAQIKQAFADEGYKQTGEVKLPEGTATYWAGEKFMSGKSWYDRFEKELYKLAQFGNFVFMDETINDILAAARKAAKL